MPQLSDSQLVVLTSACQRPDRCVFPITAKLKGNAAGNVLKSLVNKGLIKEVRAKRDDTVWRHDDNRGRMTLVATTDAFSALGIDPRGAPPDDEMETTASDSSDAGAAADAPKTQRKAKPRVSRAAAPRTRADSKQAQLIAMLRRAKGATCRATPRRTRGPRPTAFLAEDKKVSGLLSSAALRPVGSENSIRLTFRSGRMRPAHAQSRLIRTNLSFRKRQPMANPAMRKTVD